LIQGATELLALEGIFPGGGAGGFSDTDRLGADGQAGAIHE